MGINFHAIVDHNLLPAEIVNLVVLFQAEWRRAGSPLAAIPPMPGRSAWKWDLLTTSPSPEYELGTQGFLEFTAPVDLHGTAFPHALDIGSAIRWSTFLNDEKTQKILIRAVHQIAKIVKGRTILFLPDTLSSGVISDWLHEGRDVESSLVALSQTYGSPAPSLARLSDTWSDDGESWCRYFVEHKSGAG